MGADGFEPPAPCLHGSIGADRRRRGPAARGTTLGGKARSLRSHSVLTQKGPNPLAAVMFGGVPASSTSRYQSAYAAAGSFRTKCRRGTVELLARGGSRRDQLAVDPVRARSTGSRHTVRNRAR